MCQAFDLHYPSTNGELLLCCCPDVLILCCQCYRVWSYAICCCASCTSTLLVSTHDKHPEVYSMNVNVCTPYVRTYHTYQKWRGVEFRSTELHTNCTHIVSPTPTVFRCTRKVLSLPKCNSKSMHGRSHDYYPLSYIKIPVGVIYCFIIEE